jgi:hypothetical protein
MQYKSKRKDKNSLDKKESYMHMWKCIHYCQKIASMWSDKSRGVTRVEPPTPWYIRIIDSFRLI